MRSQSIQSAEENPTRKSYRSPHVSIYGDIREITKNVGMNGNPDGATKGNTKTQPN
jgi:hypothetical protein